MIIVDEFGQRQRRLLAEMDKDSVAIVFAAPERQRNRENSYPYRQDSDFYYLTGFNEPEAIAVFVPGRPEGEYILFCREHDAAAAVWLGDRIGQTGAVQDYGASQSFSIDLADEKIPELLLNRNQVYTNFGDYAEYDVRVMQWLNLLRSKARAGMNSPQRLVHIGEITHEMRMIKDAAEIKLLREACEIGVKAHQHVMQACKPGMMEYELEAELMHDYIAGGGRYPAFALIVASGANSCVLHYNSNSEKLEDGDLVLIDAGVEYQNYCSDITRTFPVNGHFTDNQRAIYEAVLRVQQGVIAKVAPGVTWNELQEVAGTLATEELVKLGLLHGDVAKLVQEKAFRQFFMHNIGHWLGIDVHDVGKYKLDAEWRVLQPGMVFTVEPGIYVAAQSEVDKKWWNIGVRIEDDVLVTENGCEVLTSAVPKTVDEIERFMSL